MTEVETTERRELRLRRWLLECLLLHECERSIALWLPLWLDKRLWLS